MEATPRREIDADAAEHVADTFGGVDQVEQIEYLGISLIQEQVYVRGRSRLAAEGGAKQVERCDPSGAQLRFVGTEGGKDGAPIRRGMRILVHAFRLSHRGLPGLPAARLLRRL